MAKEKPYKEKWLHVQGMLENSQNVEFWVNDAELDNFVDRGLVNKDFGPWFMHCKDMNGNLIYFDMVKLVYFRVMPVEPPVQDEELVALRHLKRIDSAQKSTPTVEEVLV